MSYSQTEFVGKRGTLHKECYTIQKKLSLQNNSKQIGIEKKFAKLMFEGKVNAALRLIDDQGSAGVLPLTPETLNSLKDKHLLANPPNPTILLEGEPTFVDPTIDINETEISKAALRTKDAAGPSGLDADGWKRKLVSKNFGKVGADLRRFIAEMARKLCTREVKIKVSPDENSRYTNLEAYIASRLIPLVKSPGVRPIGIGELLRRIIGKAIIGVLKPDILENAWSLQIVCRTTIRQDVAYADELGGVGKLAKIRDWWDNVCV